MSSKWNGDSIISFPIMFRNYKLPALSAWLFDGSKGAVNRSNASSRYIYKTRRIIVLGNNHSPYIARRISQN